MNYSPPLSLIPHTYYPPSSCSSAKCLRFLDNNETQLSIHDNLTISSQPKIIIELVNEFETPPPLSNSNLPPPPRIIPFWENKYILRGALNEGKY